VTKEQADRLDGFDRAFSDADRDKDGKLSKDEFNSAWAHLHRTLTPAP
jgi:Ca2+-binding EF-hand superfamily protein